MTGSISPGVRIAFLGIGQMGLHMANALVNAGYAVVGWNRSRQVFHAEASFPIVDDLANASENCHALVLCLRDQQAVEDVLFGQGVADRLRPGAIVIDMGTSGTTIAKDHFERLSARGVSYLDAPVSGGTGGAKNASLSIFVGGETDTFERARQLLAAMGRPHHMGQAGAGQSAKLANQIIVGITIAAVAEGLAYAESNGIDGPALLAALQGGFAGSRVLEVHGARMAARDYSAPGAIRLHLKDLRLAAEIGGLDGLPHARKVKSGFDDLAERGLDGLDHSAYAALYQTAKGVRGEGVTSNARKRPCVARSPGRCDLRGQRSQMGRGAGLSA